MSRSPFSSHLAVPALVAVAALLGGCAFNPDNRVVHAPAASDYRKDHPIVLANTDRSIEIFASGGRGQIGDRQIGDLRAFAADYRREGKGYLTVSIPASGAGHALPSIRRALAEGGVEYALESHYQPADPEAEAPIRLTYSRLTAAVATKCGRWPSDLSGVAGTVEGAQNKPWENFGCATQSALAQQVADPLDLVRGRPEGPTSSNRRAAVLRKYTNGERTGAMTPEGEVTINQSVGSAAGG